jgi:hypothetical protein
MGAEAEGKRKVDGKWVSGRALLETDDLIFRGEARCKIPFKDIKGLKAKGKRLEVTTAAEVFVFEIEADAEAWVKKIQNPKGRLEKLGVKPGMQIGLLCMSDERFREELEQIGVPPTTHDQDLDAVFAGAGDRSELSDFRSWRRRIAKDGSVWVVYPKGRKEITEVEVLEAGRKAGLKDVKVVRFSETHTALKFVIPLSER